MSNNCDTIFYKIKFTVLLFVMLLNIMSCLVFCWSGFSIVAGSMELQSPGPVDYTGFVGGECVTICSCVKGNIFLFYGCFTLLRAKSIHLFIILKWRACRPHISKEETWLMYMSPNMILRQVLWILFNWSPLNLFTT